MSPALEQLLAIALALEVPIEAIIAPGLIEALSGEIFQRRSDLHLDHDRYGPRTRT